MREIVPNALSVRHAAELAALVGYINFAHPLVSGLVDRVLDITSVSTADPSYARIEARPEGHPWHVDTGSKGHMGWCCLSAGVLLTPPESFTGGGLYFRDDPDTAVYHYLDLVLYDDDPGNEHCVTRSRGDRRALIMFFQGAENG